MIAAQTWYEIVLPPVVTLIVIATGFALLWLARGRVGQLAGEAGVQRISMFGVNIEFAEQRAIEAYKNQGLGRPSQSDRAAIRDAATFLAPLAAGSRVLWVDDNPANNEVERSVLVSWEIDVQSERTTDDAIRELEDPDLRFDLVISDWLRDGEHDSEDEPAGLDLLSRIDRDSRIESKPRVLFYHGNVPENDERRRRAEEASALGATPSPGVLFRRTLLELVRVALDEPRPEQLERRGRLVAHANTGR